MEMEMKRTMEMTDSRPKNTNICVRNEYVGRRQERSDTGLLSAVGDVGKEAEPSVVLLFLPWWLPRWS